MRAQEGFRHERVSYPGLGRSDPPLSLGPRHSRPGCLADCRRADDPAPGGGIRQGHAPERAGHNPLGALSVIALLGLVALQAGLGLFAIDEDGFEGGPLSDRIDFDLARQIAEWHELSFRLIQALVVLHLAAILYYVFRKREDLLRPMVTGVRRFSGPVQGLVRAPLWRLAVGVGIGLAVAFAASQGFKLGSILSR